MLLKYFEALNIVIIKNHALNYLEAHIVLNRTYPWFNTIEF